jgi:hypothetical protein
LTQSEIQAFKDCEFTNQRLGLLGYYKFNQGIHGGINTGVTSLIDNSIYNNTATLNNFALTGLNSNWINPGGVTTGVSCGELASALDFNGPTDFIYLTSALGQTVANTTAITIEYWFKGTSNQSAVRFQGPVNDFIIAGWNGRHIISGDGGTTGIAVGAAATNGNWHHIAMTWQKNTVNGFRSFLDGQLVEQRNSANVNLPPFALNMLPNLGSYDGSQEFMQGALDEVRIWNRALSQAEIQFRMNCEIPNSAPDCWQTITSIRELQAAIILQLQLYMMQAAIIIMAQCLILHLTVLRLTGYHQVVLYPALLVPEEHLILRQYLRDSIILQIIQATKETLSEHIFVQM